MMKKRIVLSMLIVFLSGITIVHAQEKCDYVYEVTYSNCDKITIGNKKAEKGVRFNDKKQIKWAKGIENQALKVWNCEKTCCELFVYNLKERRVDLVTERETSTKGWQDNQDPIVFDTMFYILDTLKVPTFTQYPSNEIVKAVAYAGNEHFDAAVSKSQDGKYYIVPRTVLGKNDKTPFYLDIIERDNKDWEYAVWRKLYIVPLPLKID